MASVSLIHLSDLHFGDSGRFSAWQAGELGKCCAASALEALNKLGASGPDRERFVVVTGDLTQTAHPTEFELAATFLGAVAGELRIDHDRFVFCPGNHDVSWIDCRIAELTERKRDKAASPEAIRNAMDEVKLNSYQDFLGKFYGAEAPYEPLANGGRLYQFDHPRLSVAALNSCERESHRKEDHVGCVSDAQLSPLLDRWLGAGSEGLLKVVAVHHPPEQPIRENVEQIIEKLLAHEGCAELLETYVSDVGGFDRTRELRNLVANARVHLVLHGHQHADDTKMWNWRKNGFAHLLSAGTSFSSELPKDQQNTLRVVAVDRTQNVVRSQVLTFNPKHVRETSVRSGAFIATDNEYEQILPGEAHPHADARSGMLEQLEQLALRYEAARFRGGPDRDRQMRESMMIIEALVKAGTLADAQSVRDWYRAPGPYPDDRRDVNGRRLVAIAAMASNPAEYFDELLEAATRKDSCFEHYHALRGFSGLVDTCRLTEAQRSRASEAFRVADAAGKFDVDRGDGTRRALACHIMRCLQERCPPSAG